jgi:hypothetical protein
MKISSLTIENRDYFSATAPEGYKGRVVFADEKGSLAIVLDDHDCEQLFNLIRPFLDDAQAKRLAELSDCIKE